jgi:hypothetical protein
VVTVHDALAASGLKIVANSAARIVPVTVRTQRFKKPSR